MIGGSPIPGRPAWTSWTSTAPTSAVALLDQPAQVTRGERTETGVLDLVVEETELLRELRPCPAFRLGHAFHSLAQPAAQDCEALAHLGDAVGAVRSRDAPLEESRESLREAPAVALVLDRRESLRDGLVPEIASNGRPLDERVCESSRDAWRHGTLRQGQELEDAFGIGGQPAERENERKDLQEHVVFWGTGDARRG